MLYEIIQILVILTIFFIVGFMAGKGHEILKNKKEVN